MVLLGNRESIGKLHKQYGLYMPATANFLVNIGAPGDIRTSDRLVRRGKYLFPLLFIFNQLTGPPSSPNLANTRQYSPRLVFSLRWLTQIRCRGHMSYELSAKRPESALSLSRI